MGPDVISGELAVITAAEWLPIAAEQPPLYSNIDFPQMKQLIKKLASDMDPCVEVIENKLLKEGFLFCSGGALKRS